MNARSVQAIIAGEYYLHGVMETATGFKLDDDGTFQFFFMYGAMDRVGEGTWSAKGDTVVLDSARKPTHDYALVKSGAGDKENIVIRMAEANEMMSHYLYCIIKGGGIEQESKFESDGTVHFSAQPIDSITLLFEFAPEKISTFTIAEKNHHYFEFRVEPWLMEVTFNNFELKYAGDHLEGGNPLLTGDTFKYEKSGY